MKDVYEISKDTSDVVQMYANVMSFPGREELRDIDIRDLKDTVKPIQEEINTRLQEILNFTKGKDEKGKIQRCIELNETIKDKLNQLTKDDFNMDQINAEVKTLTGMIYRLVDPNE